MRFLAFLLLGTLLFGFAFPAFLLLFGFLALVIAAVILITALRGGSFRIYTNRGGRGEFDDRDDLFGRRQSPPDNPEVIEPGNSAFDDEEEQPAPPDSTDDEESGEVVELPPSALRKEDDDEKDDPQSNSDK